ncbi:MAG TPA: NAD(P)/FAD-dependent oxidoreductase, partial [Thermoanaerobaculia bacterium]|nr:NAD(P)/FAD-dependent oxidoreductase [Thermoanaerobaculia bacterium]
MPRTPLFGLLQRSLRAAHAANRTGIPARELAEMRAERAWTRRRFLAASGGAAAVVAASRCAPAVTALRAVPDPVLVVGAGIAGLTAAYRLTSAGVPVRLIEAQARVGGRMWSLRDRFPDGQVIELGGELIDTNHQAIRDLANELGIALDDLSTDDPSLRGEIWFFGGAARSDAEVIEAFRPIAERIDADLATLTGDGDPTFADPSGAEALDRLSIAEWLDRNGIRGWIRDLVDVGYTTEYGLECGEQSSLNLLTMIQWSPSSFEIFGESDERFHVRGGNDAITTALASRLGVDIETGTFLESIRERPDGTLACSARRGGSSFTIAAPKVLVTLPFTMLRDVAIEMELPPQKRRAIDELGYGTNAKLMVGFDERAWRGGHRSNGSVLTDLPFQLTWETSRLQPGRAGVLTNFTGGTHGVELGERTPADQAALLVRDLERVFPGISAARGASPEVRMHWPSFRFARGSYASYRPGQWTAMRGVEGEPVRNLHFAGEHCSLAAQGFMEGGCATGEAAARA